jgi:O-antigen ligase
MCVGLVVLAELVENYASGRLFVVQDGVTAINRYNMATGWGMHNNIGGMLAMSIPFCFYRACKEKHGWIYNLLAIALMLGVVMSFSRSSMLLGGLAFAIGGAILLLRYDKGRKNLLIYGIAAAALVALAVIFREKIGELISKFLSDDLGNVSSRDKLIVNGFKQYLSELIFGGSFYPQGEYVPWDYSDQAAFSAFFPPRWHNTLIQMLASCGTVGITAYLIHRGQTVKLFWKLIQTLPQVQFLFIMGSCRRRQKMHNLRTPLPDGLLKSLRRTVTQRILRSLPR